jgi:hypothetical protein
MKERVESIMKDAHLRADDAGVLAAEVRALREELSDFETRLARQLEFNEATRLALARIESRVEAWKARTDSPHWTRAAVEIELDIKGVEV